MGLSSKRGRRAGKNIRKLALKRRSKAIISFVGAGMIIFLPFLFVKGFIDFVQKITSNNSSQPPQTIDIPLIFYVIIIVSSLGLVLQGIFLWKRANNADQGSRGEEDSIALPLYPIDLIAYSRSYSRRPPTVLSL